MSRTLLMSLSVSSLLILTSGCAPSPYYTAPPPSPLRGYQYPHWVYYNEIPPNGALLRDLERAFRAGRLDHEEYREKKRALQSE
jgi:hypothetical protein